MLGYERVLTPETIRAQLAHAGPLNASDNFLRNRLAARVDCNILDAIPQVDGFFSLVPREGGRAAELAIRRATNCAPLLDFMGVARTNASVPTNWVARGTAMPMITGGQQPTFADDETALKAIEDTGTDFRHTVFLPFEAGSALGASSFGPVEVKLLSIASNRVLLEADAGAGGMVVIAQAWFPGWRAYIDNQPATLWRANLAFQAVAAPPGRHRIELRYEDRAFDIGLVLASPGLLACAWILWRTRRA